MARSLIDLTHTEKSPSLTLKERKYTNLLLHSNKADCHSKLKPMTFINGKREANWIPASILYKSIAGRYRPVSYPDGPITARYRFIKNAYWVRPRIKVVRQTAKTLIRRAGWSEASLSVHRVPCEIYADEQADPSLRLAHMQIVQKKAPTYLRWFLFSAYDIIGPGINGSTVFDLITAHTPISAQSSNFVAFRLQSVYFLSTSL